MSAYEPFGHVTGQAQIGLARLVEVLGEPVHGLLFAARFGEDRIWAWPAPHIGWRVTANSLEAMDRFLRELIRPTRQ